MKLTRQQFLAFEVALLSAYPTMSSLKRMVRFELQEDLTEIAGGGSLTDVVFNLIIWAESKDSIEELIIKAHDYNPDNAQLSIFASQFSAPQPDSSAAPSPNSSAAPPFRRSQPMKKMTQAEIRRQLHQNFDDVQFSSLCFEEFPEIYDRFNRGMRKEQKISLLLDYCRRHPQRKEQLQKALEEWS